MAPRSILLCALVGAIFSSAAVVSACSLLANLDGLEGAIIPDASSDASVSEDGALTDGAVIDSAVDAHDTGTVTASCPHGNGPTMVMIDDEGGAPLFCIDSTEVTSTEYTQFLQDGVALSTLPAACSFKTSFTSITSSGEIPANVDWCDAFAFCQWSGKRLCGKIGGGSNAFGDYATLSSQWYYACSARGQNAFPYGAAYIPGICDDNANEAGGPVAAGSLPGCVGGFPGIFDMAGNMWEWEDSCLADGDGGSTNDQCRTRGGTWVDGDPVTRCDFDDLDHFNPVRGSPGTFMGIRCCADL